MFFEAYQGLIQGFYGFYDGSVGASIRVLQGFGRRILWFRVVLSKSCSVEFQVSPPKHSKFECCQFLGGLSPARRVTAIQGQGRTPGSKVTWSRV